MKKLNIICAITGVICFILAGYIVYNKFLREKTETIFNKEEELVLINDKLSKVSKSLGWLVIVDGIDNQSDDGSKYNISYGKNLLEEYSNKQLFVMEYILNIGIENNNFIVLNGFDNTLVNANPTDDYTIAYLDYDIFNKYYKSFFDKDFDINKQTKGNTTYDNKYVYYSNRRSGSNNVYVSMITANNITYKDDKYTVNIELTYSTRASELIGKENDTGVITYTKNINNEIIFESFILNK